MNSLELIYISSFFVRAMSRAAARTACLHAGSDRYSANAVARAEKPHSVIPALVRAMSRMASFLALVRVRNLVESPYE